MAQQFKGDNYKQTANLILLMGSVSIGCLVGAFAYPLQKFEVWRQQETSHFNQEYAKTFILTDTDNQQPYGLDLTRADKVASIYSDARLQKLLLLAISITAGGLALMISDDILPQLEVKREVSEIDAQARKQYLVEQIKHRWAMASKSQKLMFRQELKELAALFGDESLEASEINATDKFINASYLLSEGHSIDYVVAQIWQVQPNSEEFKSVKSQFEQWLNEGES